MKDEAEQSNPSTGSVGKPIYVEGLLCELDRIAGDERASADVRRVAFEAESAIEGLRTWVNELQMNTAERDAVWFFAAIDSNDPLLGRHAAALRALLKRHE